MLPDGPGDDAPERAADQALVTVTKANRQVYYQGFQVSLPSTFGGRQFYRTITDDEFLLSDIETDEVVFSFPLPLMAIEARGRYVRPTPSGASRWSIPPSSGPASTQNTWRSTSTGRTRSEKCSPDWSGRRPRTGRPEAGGPVGGSCARTLEIGCRRRGEIRCPRCCDRTHQLAGAAVPTSPICQALRYSLSPAALLSAGGRPEATNPRGCVGRVAQTFAPSTPETQSPRICPLSPRRALAAASQNQLAFPAEHGTSSKSFRTKRL